MTRGKRTAHSGQRTAQKSTNYDLQGSKKTGTVFLVGAGPGDPGLLTLRGYEALRQADVVLYDSLVHPVVVDYAHKAEKIFVGKLSHLAPAPLPQPANAKHLNASGGRATGMDPKGHCRAPDQDEINRLMVEHAKQGKRVVRLKGGDPFVFGRGGEEAGFLKSHDVPFEIISGVSAGFSVPAFAGIPVTDRRFTSAVVFVTAHENVEKQHVAVDWKKLAQIQATLVCFMGVKSLPDVVRQLVQGGKSSSTPICVIEWGTLARQRVIEGTLQNIASRALSEKIESPALTVIGEVVTLRKSLEWFGQKSLSGRRILITRATADAGPFRAMLEAEGAQVCEAPMIKIEPPQRWENFDREVNARLERFGWILFTSLHAVDYFFARLKELGKDSRALGKCKIAAVGDATGDALRARGIEPDILPRVFHTRELVRELQDKTFVRGQKFLWPRGDIAPLDLKNELEQAGAEVTDAILYTTVPDPEGKRRVAEILAEAPIDYVVFTSGSGVKNFYKGLGAKEANQTKGKAVSIGPQTSQALNEFKIAILAEAKTHNLDGLMQTLKDLSGRPPTTDYRQQTTDHRPSTKDRSHARRPETGDRRHETEKPVQETHVLKPAAPVSALASRVQESKARIHSHAPRSATPKVQRFAPRPPRKR